MAQDQLTKDIFRAIVQSNQPLSSARLAQMIPRHVPRSSLSMTLRFLYIAGLIDRTPDRTRRYWFYSTTLPADTCVYGDHMGCVQQGGDWVRIAHLRSLREVQESDNQLLRGNNFVNQDSYQRYVDWYWKEIGNQDLPAQTHGTSPEPTIMLPSPSATPMPLGRVRVGNSIIDLDAAYMIEFDPRYGDLTLSFPGEREVQISNVEHVVEYLETRYPSPTGSHGRDRTAEIEALKQEVETLRAQAATYHQQQTLIQSLLDVNGAMKS